MFRVLPVKRYPLWLLVLAGIPAVLVAVFFFTVFLICLAFLAAALTLVLWWGRRQQRRAAGRGVIEGSYTVVDEEKQKGPQ